MPVIVQILIQLLGALPGIIKAGQMIQRQIRTYSRVEKAAAAANAKDIAKAHTEQLLASLNAVHAGLKSEPDKPIV